MELPLAMIFAKESIRFRLPGLRVARVLDRLHAAIGLPQCIVVDNGPEFAGRTLDAWAYARGVTLRFIRPGKPIENAYVESFNGKFRDGCLNEHWFISLADAKAVIESWRVDYNTVRPHSSLDGATPEQFARITAGARRLMPARPDEGRKPEDLSLSVWRMEGAGHNILPEQTLGRGLRRMYFGTDMQETVSVMGTPAFIDFVESIQSEGVTFDHVPMGSGTTR